MRPGNGQEEFRAWGRLGSVSSWVQPDSGGREADMGVNSPPFLQTTAENTRVQPQRSKLASAANEPLHEEAMREVSFLSYLPYSRSEVGQLRAGAGEAITLGVQSAERSLYRGRITGPIRFINQLIDSWRLDADSACTLLGFERSDSAYVRNVLQGYATLRGRDAKDRIAHLFEIRSALSALFRDVDVENEWLREGQQVLNGKKPMELLEEGSMENLLLVKEYVELVSGR